MSNPTYFCYDICGLRITDMDCMDIVKNEDNLEPQDEHHKVEKLKESHLLLKKKLSLSHELIKQYNDKIKECEEVNTELQIAKHNVETITQKHSSSLMKIKQLIRENDEYRQKIDNFSKTISDQEIKIAADRQHVQQLMCKMHQREQVHSSKSKKEDNWKEKVKSLENELKEVRKSHEFEINEMEIKMNILKTAGTVKNQIKKETKITHEKSTCTGNELEPVIIRPKMVDKCVLTNDFYSIKDDPYPLFCAKCETKLDPMPLDQILNQMSTCPPLITEVTSPPRRPVIIRPHINPRHSVQRELIQPEVINDNVYNVSQNLGYAEKCSEVPKSDFERLEHKICLLERKLKKTKKKGMPVRNQCSSCEHLKNFYVAPPYHNMFQSGAMMQTQAELLEFKNWQQGLISRKRRLPINIQKSSRRGKKLIKKRKMQDGTSEWHVDPIPVREPVNFDHGNTFKKHSDTSSNRLRVKSPLLNCKETKIKSSKRHKERSEALLSLFSTSSCATSPSHSDCDSDAIIDEELCHKTQMDCQKSKKQMQNATSPGHSDSDSDAYMDEEHCHKKQTDCQKSKKQMRNAISPRHSDLDSDANMDEELCHKKQIDCRKSKEQMENATLPNHSDANMDEELCHKKQIDCQKSKKQIENATLPNHSDANMDERSSHKKQTENATSPSHSDFDSDANMDEELCQKKQMDCQKSKKQIKNTTSPSHSDFDSDANMDEQLCHKKQMDSPKSNVSIEPEIVKSSDRTSEHLLDEHETGESISNELTKSVKKPAQKSSKLSLMRKITNFKKSCSNTKPPVKNVVPVSNKKPRLIHTKVSIENADVNNEGRNDVGTSKLVENEANLSIKNDYIPMKKHRIAHANRKPENRSLYGINHSDSSELPKIIESGKSSVEDNTVNNNQMDNCKSDHVAAVKVSNGNTDDVEMTSDGRDFNSLARLEGENRSNDISDTEFSSLISKPSVTCSNGSTDKSISNDRIDMRESIAHKTSVTKEVISLQPCIVIPRICLDVAGVANLHNAMHRRESTNTRKDSPVPNMAEVSKTDTTPRILRSKTKVNRSNSTVSSSNEPGQATEDAVNKNLTSNKPKTISWVTKVDLASDSDVICSPEYPNNDEVSEAAEFDDHDVSIPIKSNECEDPRNKSFDNETTISILARPTHKKRTRLDESSASPIRELRSRSILLSPSKNSSKHDGEETNNDIVSNTTDSAKSNVNMQSNKSFGPIPLLQQYLMGQGNLSKEKSMRRKTFNEKLQRRKENLVLNELSELVGNEEWTSTIFSNTTEKLLHFKTHTIAKCTIDFLCTKAEEKESLDRTYTPPAPLLSKTQQRIITMLVVLNRSIPDLIRLVQTGIEYKLFRLGSAPEVEVIQELTRVFTALCRIQKDRERVRILCCDSLYCLGMKAMPLMYTILISWPEVLPMAGTSNDPLVFCLTQAIIMHDGDTSFTKFLPLKKLLSYYYRYTSEDPSYANITKKFMTALKDKRENGLDTAVILLAKRKGTTWAYKNIIQGGLLQMIIERVHPSIYDAFCLLGYILRSFSVNDKQGVVKNILEQLCALMESGEGSMQQQEGVATALLSLSRHKFDVVAKALLSWKPCEPISETTIRLLNNMFRVYQPGWWNKLLHKNCIKLSDDVKM